MRTRQAVLTGPRNIEFREAEIVLPDDHVLVQMEGTGLCTSELPQWTGRKPDYPMVPGHEGWGVVVDKGKAVSGRIKPGDRVTGLPMRCCADYFTQPEWCTMVLRPDLGQQCVPGEPYYCVNNVVRAAHPTVGDCLVIVGLGPMGQWALQGLAATTLHALVAIDVDPRKLELATAAGATHTVNSAQCDAVETVRAITGGRMADVVVEGTGAKAGMDLSVKLLRKGPRPRLVVMSFFAGPIEMDISHLCGVSAEIICAHPGIVSDRPDHCRRTEIMINRGVFTADHLVTHRFRLEDTAAGYAALETRPAGLIKAVVMA